MNFGQYRLVLDLDDLLEAGGLGEELAVRGLVIRVFWVVCSRAMRERDQTTGRALAKYALTFHHPRYPNENVLPQQVFIKRIVVQRDCGGDLGQPLPQRIRSETHG